MPADGSQSLINQFVERYRREFDFFEQASRIVAQRLESLLESSGIRAIVTWRAKSPKRLEAKIRQRIDEEGKQYQTAEDIYADIVDFSGVRIALYFPAERNEVRKIVGDNFTVLEEPKVFEGTPTSQRRFSGYWATHYRIRLRESDLPDEHVRFASARVEIQVASILMHAWSEVEHDLVYKPMQGELSDDELSILDQLNGMVLAGEMALEHLQRAGKARVSSTGARFENHYDLASFLLEQGRHKLADVNANPPLGDVELLYRLLSALDFNRADQLLPFLQTVTLDFEQRPFAQQIIDQIVAADPDRYAIYSSVRTTKSESSYAPGPTEFLIHQREERTRSLDDFMSQWIIFERFLKELAKERKNVISVPLTSLTSKKFINVLGVFVPNEVEEIERIRRIRNFVVHEHGSSNQELINDGVDGLGRLFARLDGAQDEDIRQALVRARRNDRNV